MADSTCLAIPDAFTFAEAAAPCTFVRSPLAAARVRSRSPCILGRPGRSPSEFIARYWTVVSKSIHQPEQELTLKRFERTLVRDDCSAAPAQRHHAPATCLL